MPARAPVRASPPPLQHGARSVLLLGRRSRQHGAPSVLARHPYRYRFSPVPARPPAQRAARPRAGTDPAPARAARGGETIPTDLDLKTATERFQRQRVEASLRATGGNRTRAAERLGVSRQWLHRLMERWAERE